MRKKTVKYTCVQAGSFSKNDVIANTCVILGGILVWILNSRWPDLVIDALISLVILNGAKHIMVARQELSSINGGSELKGYCSDSDD